MTATDPQLAVLSYLAYSRSLQNSIDSESFGWEQQTGLVPPGGGFGFAAEVFKNGNDYVIAYSGEDDQRFRRNVTGDSAASVLWMFSTRVGHDQSRFCDFQPDAVCRVSGRSAF